MKFFVCLNFDNAIYDLDFFLSWFFQIKNSIIRQVKQHVKESKWDKYEGMYLIDLFTYYSVTTSYLILEKPTNPT